MARSHAALREGARLGLTAATGIWVWIVIVDALAGQPFRTFTALGGIVPFTILHYLLNVAYGVVIVFAIRRAEREPSLVIAVAFGFLIVEFGFAMLTVLLSQISLGRLAWVRILGGSVIGAVIALLMLSRKHSLREELRKAEQAEND